MNIVVLLKQVHDPNIPRAALRIANGGRALEMSAGSPQILNGYDANALEEGIRLRDIHGGTLTAISVGPESARDVLRRAIAMGADRALHADGASGLDSDAFTTATLLAAAIRTVGAVDLVLAGRSASDTDAGVVPILVAGLLGYAVVTPVRSVAIENGGAVIADRITGSGIRRVRLRGSAVLGISNEINKPRNPALKGVVAAKRAAIPTLSAEQLGVAPVAPGLQTRRLFIPPLPSSTAEMIPGGSAEELGRALADRLHLEGLLR
jgi:electron transfer flavoprotein beta subunit